MKRMPTYPTGLSLGLEMVHVKLLGEYQLLKGKDYPCLVFLRAKCVSLVWIGSKSCVCLGMVLEQRIGLTIVELGGEEAESGTWDGGDCTIRRARFLGLA